MEAAKIWSGTSKWRGRKEHSLKERKEKGRVHKILQPEIVTYAPIIYNCFTGLLVQLSVKKLMPQQLLLARGVRLSPSCRTKHLLEAAQADLQSSAPLQPRNDRAAACSPLTCSLTQAERAR